MTEYSNWVVITDLDGTIMDHHYDYSPALKTILTLQRNNIPIIPCTSKTSAEVRHFRSKIPLYDPFIVENGGAIYGINPKDSSKSEIILGKTYNYLRPYLDVISTRIGYKLRAFKDLNSREIYTLTGLQGSSQTLALSREWSVPFLNPTDKDYNLVVSYAQTLDLNILQGNLMSHLISKGSDKGNAVKELKKVLNIPDIKVLALGDSPNDLPLLNAADISIVVPGLNGHNPVFTKYIKDQKFQLASGPNAYGWSASVENFFCKIFDANP